ncbi:heat shock 70 kDa protein-like isoform X5 [Homalodisca vitripennis]|uniref:heat shock 70 kDa protein-like isoform X5 n=1 Tax=Homalodisca vitripennis TaxID=197043 RepID=UPI001EEA812F|nr:heat shock 70 kDa protein-like isoform X5 [Homalodisca vitripennis]
MQNYVSSPFHAERFKGIKYLKPEAQIVARNLLRQCLVMFLKRVAKIEHHIVVRWEESSQSSEPREAVTRNIPKKTSRKQVAGSSTMGESSRSTVQQPLPFPEEQRAGISSEPREAVPRNIPKKTSRKQVAGSSTMGESSRSTVQQPLPFPEEQRAGISSEPREAVPHNIPKKSRRKNIAMEESCIVPLLPFPEEQRADTPEAPLQSSKTFPTLEMDEDLRTHFQVLPEVFEDLGPATKPKIAFGIDIGTARICISEVRRARILQTIRRLTFKYENNPASPVRFSSTSILIGDKYRCKLLTSKNDEVCGLLRLAGLRYDDYVRELCRYWPFTVVDIDGWPHMECMYKKKKYHISPEKLLYEILRYFRHYAIEVSGEEDPYFVITVPGSCTYNQRRVVKRAANSAGLKSSLLINDTTALMIERWAGLKRGIFGPVVVVDVGGGSVSITSFMVSDKRIRVMSNVGDCHWGGDDIDNTIISYCLEQIRDIKGGKCFIL